MAPHGGSVLEGIPRCGPRAWVLAMASFRNRRFLAPATKDLSIATLGSELDQTPRSGSPAVRLLEVVFNPRGRFRKSPYRSGIGTATSCVWVLDAEPGTRLQQLSRLFLLLPSPFGPSTHTRFEGYSSSDPGLNSTDTLSCLAYRIHRFLEIRYPSRSRCRTGPSRARRVLPPESAAGAFEVCAATGSVNDPVTEAQINSSQYCGRARQAALNPAHWRQRCHQSHDSPFQNISVKHSHGVKGSGGNRGSHFVASCNNESP